MGSVLKRFTFLLLISGLTACSALPQQGPKTSEIISDSGDLDYVLITVDQRVTDILSAQAPRGFSAGFGTDTAEPPSNRVGVGDILSIRIVEAGNGGLFSNGPMGGTGNADFPVTVVDEKGTISLPYTGEISVAGLSPVQIQNRIVEQLQGKAIEPQAVVNVARSVNNKVTMAGDLVRPGNYELTLRGDRLSDAIANSGGSRVPAHETTVTVTRNGRSASMSLDDVLKDPRQDIRIQRGDLIVLTQDPKRYTMLGAVQRGGAFPFGSSRFSVLEAVAAAGGPLDARADPTGVFVFRPESPAVLKALGVDNLDAYPSGANGIPTVYRFNLQETKSQFYAQSFLLANRDSVYVSNAPAVQLSKVLTLFDAGFLALQRGETLTN